MKSKIRSVQKLFWAVLLVGTSVDVRGVESTPNGMITRSMATDRNRVMETTVMETTVMETTVMDATSDMNPIPMSPIAMQEPLSTEEADSKLSDAVMMGNLEWVKELTHKDREFKLRSVELALACAVKEGHAEMCKHLLSARPTQIPHGYRDWEPSDQRKTDTDTIHMDTTTGNPTKRQKTDHESN